jgi:phosphatidylglycerophosphatase A
MNEKAMNEMKDEKAAITRLVFTKPDYFIAYGFGSGLAPKAPGTAGSALALVLFIGMATLPVLAQIAIILVALALGIYLTGKVALELELKDPSAIVWDEFVGMWITLLFLPPGWVWYLVAFALFRLFDIVKPWPVSVADTRLTGGLGIMLDDVVAGLYALAAIQLSAALIATF